MELFLWISDKEPQAVFTSLTNSLQKQGGLQTVSNQPPGIVFVPLDHTLVTPFKPTLFGVDKV